LKQRLPWIDFLRGIAVLGMIETHAVNTFLDPIYRAGPWFVLVSYVNGWVAPTFLFLAGYLQGLSVRKNWETPRPIGRRLGNLGVILAIGYGLQFPWDHAFDWPVVSAALGRVDVLHCIAVTLAILLVLSRFCKRLVTYDRLVLGLALGSIIAAPFVWTVPFATNPLTGYLSPAPGALFPLFPWSAFIFAGALASRFQLPKTRSGREAHLIESAATAGRGDVSGEPPKTAGQRPALPGAFIMAALLMAAAGWVVSWMSGEWMHSQPYAARYDTFLFRVSAVLASAAFCASIVHGENSITRAINWCGSRSLPLYVWHLVLLHSGLGIIPPLRELFSRTQPPAATFLLYLLTLGGTLFLTWLWQLAQRHAARFIPSLARQQRP